MTSMSQDRRNETLLLWQIHDSLLQAYRGQFFSFQAIAMAGALLAIQLEPRFRCDSLHLAILVALVVFGPLFIVTTWLPIVHHRGHMVTCVQLLLARNLEPETAPFAALAALSRDSALRRTEEYRNLRKGPTRRKLDVVWPVLFLLLWLLLLSWWVFRAAATSGPNGLTPG